MTTDLQDYYQRRATAYERIYAKPERQADLRAMEAWLPTPFAGRRVLEVACGTAWWTPHGSRDCQHWLATDVNPAMLDIARHKPLSASQIEFATVNAWTFDGLEGRSFDAAFAGCWWSHVPLQHLSLWLDLLHAHLEPGARVVMLDNRFVAGSSTPIAREDDLGNTYQTRTLDDGSVHDVLKNFPTREQAVDAIGERAIAPEWIEYPHYWILSYRLS